MAELGPVTEVVVDEQTVLEEPVDADEVRVAGHRREALVGRIAVAGGSQREYLPVAASGLRQPLDPSMGGVAEVADPVGSREAGRMEEDARGTFEEHRTILVTMETQGEFAFARARPGRGVGSWPWRSSGPDGEPRT